MAENDNIEDEENEQTPKDLRKQLALEKKQSAELREQVEKLLAKDRTATLSSLVTSKGLNAKVANLIPATVDVSDPASIEAWLTEYQDVFGAPKAAEDADDDGIDDATKTAHQRVADATAGAQAAGKLADLESRIAGAQNKKELDAILASA